MSTKVLSEPFLTASALKPFKRLQNYSLTLITSLKRGANEISTDLKLTSDRLILITNATRQSNRPTRALLSPAQTAAPIS